MNQKNFNLFKKLILNNNKPLLIDDMSAFFHVGTRTLYNYWDEICDYLIKLDLRAPFSFDGKEFKCQIDETMKQYLIASLRTMSFYEYKLSGSERQAIMSVIFLISSAPIKSSSFNDILCVSQNTVANDLKEVKKLFDSYRICFHENKSHGFVLECTEPIRRNLLLKIFDDQNIIQDYFINTPANPCISYICDYMKLEKYRHLIEAVVKEVEDKIHMHMTDYNFYKVVTILLIITVRNQAGYPILYKEEYPAGIKSYDQLSLLTECIFHGLDSVLNAAAAEPYYFMDRIQHYKLVSEKPSNTYNEVLFSLVIKEFLTTVSGYYKYDLLNDTSLTDYLNAHISACYNRLKKNIIIENPYLSEMKKKYRQDFLFLKDHIYILENALHISFNDGEIAYILMHILAAIEKDRNSMDFPNVVVICHGGLATSNYLSTQLHRHFKLNIAATCSIHNAKNIIKEHSIDLIISTMPVSEFNIPTVEVNALLMDEDIRNLREKLSLIQKHYANQSYALPHVTNVHSQSLQSMLSRERIVLDKEVLDWKEAIISAGELLLWDKLISVNYLHTMIDLIVKYGAYIVIAPHIALAHAAPSDGARDSGVSVVRLKYPVEFGKEKLDPVKIVVACAFLDTTENANTLLRLMRSILKPDFLSIAAAAETPQEILDYFK